MKQWVIGVWVIIVLLVLMVFLAYRYVTDDPQARDAQRTQQAIETGDVRICNGVSRGYMMSMMRPRADCYAAVIKKNRDSAICSTRAIKGLLGEEECLILSGAVEMPSCSGVSDTLFRHMGC